MSRPRTTNIDDVDQLVQMINLNGPRQQQSVNPKKAAKKARQKARKEEEKRQQEEAERAALFAQQRKALEEQLERAARELQQLKLASKAYAKRNEAAGRNSKENQPSCKDLNRGNKNNNRKGASKVIRGTVSEVSPCAPAKCTHLCSIHTSAGDQSFPAVQHEGVEGGKKKKKKKKKKTSADQEEQMEVYEDEEEDDIADFVNELLKSEPVVEETAAPASKRKKTKNRKKGAKEQLPESNSTRNAASPASTSVGGVSDSKSGGKTTPYVVNVPNSPAFSLEPGKMTNYLHSGNSHLDWNKFSSGDVSTTSAKPEMVTIRRHPTVSDTTVTISIKNQNGEEDILYTLLNGQVVRAKPNTVEIDNFIADESVPKAGPQSQPKPSKRKRNRKKTSKKDSAAPSPAPAPVPSSKHGAAPRMNPVEFIKSNDRDVVVCTPILQPPEPVSQPVCPSQPAPPDQPRRSYSYVNDLDDTAEIDLSKLKLPPGITITKVNQPTSSFSGLAEKTHPKDDVTNTVGSSCAPVTSPLAGYYPHEKTNPKSNVIVVDSQAYSADNESDDASERTNGRREGMPGKVKRLRSRLSRHSCGGDRGDCQEKRISVNPLGGADTVPYGIPSSGWQPSEEALGSAGLNSTSAMYHPHFEAPVEMSTRPSVYSRPQPVGAKRKQPTPSCSYQTDLYIDGIGSFGDAESCQLYSESPNSGALATPNVNFRSLAAQMYSGMSNPAESDQGVNGYGCSHLNSSLPASDFLQDAYQCAPPSVSSHAADSR